MSEYGSAACADEARCVRRPMPAWGREARHGALGGKAAVSASAGATAAQPGAMSDVVAETDDETIARCAPRVAAVMSRAKGGKRRAAEAESAQSAKRDKEDTTSMKEEGTDGDGTTKLPPIEADRLSPLARLVADAVQWGGGGEAATSFPTLPANFPRLSPSDLAEALRTLKEYRVGVLRRNKCVLSPGLALSHLRAWIDAALHCAGCASRHSTDSAPLAVCDACSRAWHAACVGLSALPATELFFCPRCVAAPIAPLAKLWPEYRAALADAKAAPIPASSSVSASVSASASASTHNVAHTPAPASAPPRAVAPRPHPPSPQHAAPPSSPSGSSLAPASSPSRLRALDASSPPPPGPPANRVTPTPAPTVAPPPAVAPPAPKSVAAPSASTLSSSNPRPPLFPLPALEDLRKRDVTIAALEHQLGEVSDQIEASRTTLAAAQRRHAELTTLLQTERAAQVASLSSALNDSHRLFYELLEALSGNMDRRQLDQLRQKAPAALVQQFRAILRPDS